MQHLTRFFGSFLHFFPPRFAVLIFCFATRLPFTSKPPLRYKLYDNKKKKRKRCVEIWKKIVSNSLTRDKLCIFRFTMIEYAKQGTKWKYHSHFIFLSLFIFMCSRSTPKHINSYLNVRVVALALALIQCIHKHTTYILNKHRPRLQS